jgi:replicative DNA helicase
LAARAQGDGSASHRLPPQDLEAEKAVISGLLLDNTAIHTILPELRAEDFYHPAHRTLYESIVALGDESQPVDLHTLSNHLSNRKKLDEVGGALFLAEVADYESTAANVLHHARIVREKALKRNLISTATEIIQSVYDEPHPADKLLDLAEGRIFGLGQAQARSAFKSLRQEMDDTFDFVESLRQGEITGVPTGFEDLDKLTGGFQRGDLVIIAARPSMGKTAFALNMARNAAVQSGKKVGVFSLEMNRRSLTLRLLSAEAEVDVSRFHRGYVSTRDLSHLTTAAGRLSGAPIWIDDSSSLSVLEMRAKARRLQHEHGLDLLVIDYLQLAQGAPNVESRTQEISQISRGLKGLAKELDIPVIALSQLNRGPELRGEGHRRPMLADLRDSGAIEQDADLVMFIYRAEFYNRDDPENAGIAEIIIAKQRNGPTDTVKLQFDRQYARFRNLSERGDGGYAPPPPDPTPSAAPVRPPDRDEFDDPF